MICSCHPDNRDDTFDLNEVYKRHGFHRSEELHKLTKYFYCQLNIFYAMNPTARLLVIPAALVLTFRTPTFDISRLILVSLPPAPPVAKVICCPALSHACVVSLFVTLHYCKHLVRISRNPIYLQRDRSSTSCAVTQVCFAGSIGRTTGISASRYCCRVRRAEG